MRVLTELKTVISVRAVEINKREQAALQKMYPDLHKPSTPEHVGQVSSDCTMEDKNSLEIRPVNTDVPSKQTGDFDVPELLPEKLMEDVSQNKAKGQNIEMESLSGKNVTESFTESESMKTRIEEKYKAPSDLDTHDQSTFSNERNKKTDYVLADNKSQDSPEKDKDDVFLSKVDQSKQEQIIDKGVNRGKPRNCKSYVTNMGIRRLRKNNMLEICQSESDEEVDKNMDFYYDSSSNSSQEDDVQNDKPRRIGLPLLELTGKKTGNDTDCIATGDKDEKTDEIKSDSVGTAQFRLPVMSLEDRLQRLSGSGFGFTSDLAEEAVARSKVFNKMEEETFGGEVYGELSDDGQSSPDEDIEEDQNEFVDSG